MGLANEGATEAAVRGKAPRADGSPPQPRLGLQGADALPSLGAFCCLTFLKSPDTLGRIS